MAASYPDDVKTWEPVQDGVDDVLAEHINEAYDEIIAIENDLIPKTGLQFLHKLENQMGTFVGGTANLGVGATVAVRPSAGEHWCITNVQKAGEINLYLTDGANTSKISDTTVNGGGGFGVITNDIYINRDNWLVIEDASGNGQTVSWRGYMVDDGDVAITQVVAGFTDPYGVASIRPAAGEEWIITVISHGINTGMIVTDGVSTLFTLNTSNHPFFDNKQKIRLTNDLYISSTSYATAWSGFVLVPEPPMT